MILKERYVAVFLVKEYDSYTVVKRKRIKANAVDIEYDKENTYIVDISKPTYIKGLRRIYCFDINKGQIIMEGSDAIKLDPKTTSLILSQNFFKQAFSSIRKGLGIDWISLIAGAGIGAFAGLIVGLML